MVEVKPPDSFRPFCSERCRLADLGKWLDGAYKISAPVCEEDLDQGVVSDDTDSEGSSASRSAPRGAVCDWLLFR